MDEPARYEEAFEHFARLADLNQDLRERHLRIIRDQDPQLEDLIRVLLDADSSDETREFELTRSGGTALDSLSALDPPSRSASPLPETSPKQ